MSTTYYICKYTPVELLRAFGGECQILNEMPENFDLSDQVSHPNICGFGKSLLEACMEGRSMSWCWSTAATPSAARMIS